MPQQLSGQLANIMFGTLFLFVGLIAGAFAVLRRQEGSRLFAWLGAWSGMYGLRLLLEAPAFVALLPHWLQACVPLVWTLLIYLMLPVAVLAWLELSLGIVRRFLWAVIVLAFAIGLGGIAVFAITGSWSKLLYSDNLLASAALLLLVVVISVPSLARKYLILPNRRIIVAGTLIFALEELYFNLAFVFHYPLVTLASSLGLAALLLSFGYVAVQIALKNERKLLSIENELAIAREIQASILPSGNPKLKHLRVSAVYHPMTAVAGDFYEFIVVDENRVGVLVTDVTGHGVPAALIAAMIKIAIESVLSHAHEPGEVLRGLNRILSERIHAQLVSAAYLWLDTENRVALYSGAGHPPMLHLRHGKVARIESNGVPLGVLPNPEYPVCQMQIAPGDRFLLYTDGVTETENAQGHFFGEVKLDEVVLSNRSGTTAEFVENLLGEIRRWRSATLEQQDDITMVVVDVLA